MKDSSAELFRGSPIPLGADDLTQGLTLLRASTLKIIRLQLAMERQDRRVALETVDDLMALDRRLRDHLALLPTAESQLLFRRELDGESSILNREKLSLASEVHCRPAQQGSEDLQAAAGDTHGAEAVVIGEEKDLTGTGSYVWMVAMIVALCVIGAVLYLSAARAIIS